MDLAILSVFRSLEAQRKEQLFSKYLYAQFARAKIFDPQIEFHYLFLSIS